GGVGGTRAPLDRARPERSRGLLVALAGRPLTPARRLPRLPWTALPLEQHVAEPVLRSGVAEIRGRVGEQIARPLWIGLHPVGDAFDVVLAERHEGVGNVARLRRAQAVVGMALDAVLEVAEPPRMVADALITVGVLAAALPRRDRVGALGGVFERAHATLYVARLQQLHAIAERLGGRLGVRGAGQRRRPDAAARRGSGHVQRAAIV